MNNSTGEQRSDDAVGDTAASSTSAHVGDSGITDDLVKKRQASEKEGTPTPGGKRIRVNQELSTNNHTPEQQSLISRCNVLKISPPKDQDGKIAETTDVNKRVQEDGFGSHLGSDSDEERILLFLYGRGFFRNNVEERKANVEAMLEKDSRARGSVLQLIRLEGDNFESETIQYKKKSNVPKWKILALEYGNNDGCNIFTEHGAKLIQRVQLSGNCFLHAPIVVQSYMLRTDTTEVVDICKYGRNALGCEQLAQFLVHHNGGDSFSVLNNILDKKGLFMSFGPGLFDAKCPNCTCGCRCEMEHNLKAHGAGLVYRFQLEDKFLNYKQPSEEEITLPSFDGEIVAPLKMKFHAMVLVGMRKVGDQWWLLLQNWWPQMQFVEVSQQYFLSCKPNVAFVMNVQNKIPDKFERCNHDYAEAQMEGSDVPEVVYETSSITELVKNK